MCKQFNVFGAWDTRCELMYGLREKGRKMTPLVLHMLAPRCMQDTFEGSNYLLLALQPQYIEQLLAEITE